MGPVKSGGFATISEPSALETTAEFAPRFDKDGLISAIVTDASSGDVLMLAHMNAKAIKKTIETGFAWFWSRSRAELWQKGAVSGETLLIAEIRTDCDQDALLLKVRPQKTGAACHTGRKSCFYRRLESDGGELRLVMDSEPPLFDPATVYGRK